MNKKDHLFTARWALTKAIDTNDFGSILDFAVDEIAQAKADSITQDIDEPERPNTTPKDIEDREKYIIPEIVTVPGVRFKERGPYKTKTGQAMGLVVHYTVSGRTKNSAKAVLNSLAKRNLGCMVMDEDGVIYVPEKFDLKNDVAYHAGTSSWKGKSGISFYCMGMEICCWGKLDKTTKKYVDARDIRTSKGEDNIKSGEYQKYVTPAQEEALLNFILWQLDTNPEFKIEWVVGHDEVAPSRKSDPGASLSKSMPKYREMLKNLK
jgi:N-acetylmuramoyl-L-alanine amidase